MSPMKKIEKEYIGKVCFNRRNGRFGMMSKCLSTDPTYALFYIYSLLDSDGVCEGTPSHQEIWMEEDIVKHR